MKGDFPKTMFKQITDGLTELVGTWLGLILCSFIVGIFATIAYNGIATAYNLPKLSYWVIASLVFAIDYIKGFKSKKEN